MRLSTAGTRRAIDRWKAKASLGTDRFYGAVASAATLLLLTPRRRRLILAVPVAAIGILGLAFLELALVILVGFLVAKLACYRLVNSVLLRARFFA